MVMKNGHCFRSLCLWGKSIFLLVIFLLIFFSVFFLFVNISATVQIVSIGSACNVARAARHNNLRTVAYPFDWTITSMSALRRAFEDDFVQLLVPEQMHENEDRKSVVDGYGIVYIHDFPTVRYPVALEDDEIMPVHTLLPSWRDSIDIVKAKFNRRLERLFDMLNTGQSVALVRYNEMDRYQAEQFIELLKQKFPYARVELAVIGMTSEFKEPWNIPHVSNFYIDEKDFGIWDGPAWSEVMQKIALLDPQSWFTKTVCMEIACMEKTGMATTQDAPYVLTLPCYNPGLFSAFNTVLGALDYYDRGLISGLRVDFGKQGWYFDASRGDNWWHYYFDPIAVGFSLDTAEHIKNFPVVDPVGVHNKTISQTSAILPTLSKFCYKNSEQLFPTYQKIVFAYESQFEMPPKRAHELIQKYIHVRPHIMQQIDAFWRQHCAGYFVIGVHYRGTDKLEADPVSYDIVIGHVHDLIAEHKDKCIKIFVATDDAGFALYMKNQFPENLVMRDALRSDNAEGVHMRADFDPYKKGEDVVIDCLLLSKCSSLIKMASNVSDCSLQFNPDMPVIRLNKSYSE